MANAVEVDIAEAIKEELNTHDFGIEFQAERSEADATVPLTELGVLRVDVVPWLPDSELETRGELEYTIDVDILIRKKFGGSEQDISTGRIPLEDTDALRKLRQDITEFFMPSAPGNSGAALSDVPTAYWQDKKVMFGLVRPHMKQHRQFTGWVRLTFCITKAAETAPLKS